MCLYGLLVSGGSCIYLFDWWVLRTYSFNYQNMVHDITLGLPVIKTPYNTSSLN